MTENNGISSLHIKMYNSCFNSAGIEQFSSHDIELNELQELKETLTELQKKLSKISCMLT